MEGEVYTTEDEIKWYNELHHAGKITILRGILVGLRCRTWDAHMDVDWLERYLRKMLKDTVSSTTDVESTAKAVGGMGRQWFRDSIKRAQERRNT